MISGLNSNIMPPDIALLKKKYNFRCSKLFFKGNFPDTRIKKSAGIFQSLTKHSAQNGVKKNNAVLIRKLLLSVTVKLW